MKLNTIKNIKLLSFILVFLTIIAISPMTFADDVNWSDWTQLTSSFETTYINSVATDETTWVAVGNSGKLATATDPTGTWTQRTSSFGTSNILSVATDGNIWVAVGTGGKLATATDPTGTWTQRTSSFGTSNIYSVAYGNGVWVAVGTSGKLATATNPTGTWTQRTSSFSTNNIWSVAYGNEVWVAVGNSGTLATATNPTGTWTQRTSSFETSAINSIAYGNGVWIAAGDEGKLATATDPTGTWTQRTSSFDYRCIYSVAYGNGVWVAVGDEGKLATATDPTGTWTQRTSSFDYGIKSVATDGNIWIIGGLLGKLAYLSTIIETVTPSFATGTYNNNLSVTLTTNHNGSTGIYYTTDGSTPDNTNTLYTEAITISGTTTLKAVSYNGTNYSEVMTETYTMVVGGTASANVNTGTYNNNQTVTLTKAGTTSGTKLTYTTNGSNPTIASTEYTTPLLITGTTILKFAEFKTSYTPSAIQTKTYTMVVSDPVITQSTGTYNNDFTTTITSGTTGASIYYTTDGSVPDNTDTLYSGAITINATTTLKAIAYKTNYTTSGIDTKTYTMVVSDPVITKSTGTYNNDFTTTITSGTTGASIYYTTDGSVPDNTDNLYSGAITINSTQTLKAIAYKAGYTTSGVDTETYTMVVFGTPTADQNAGVYYKPISVALTKNGTTTGTTLTYTTNGTNPTIASTEYTTPITIAINNDQNTTLKFAEFKTGYTSSAIQTLEFDITFADDVNCSDWSQLTSSFGTSYIWSVATDGITWVAVGENGKLATATDPTGTWTQRTSSFGTSIRSVATNGTTWVAVGSYGKLATATDPTGTWTQRTSSFENNIILSVAYGNGVWVAVGSSGKLATATDPTGTWTQRTSSFEYYHIYSVTYENGVWVAVGENGKLATATDPTGTWTQRTSSFETSHIRSVAYGNGVWVAVGENGKLATATDPTGTWTQRTSSFETSHIRSVATNGTTWVAVGENGKLAIATDPTGTWTQRTSSFETNTIQSVATDGTTWVAVGGSGKLAYLIAIKNIVTPSFTTGTYYNNLSVTLTTDQKNSTGIYYTTDGSIPNNTDTLYTGPITISETTTLKAVSYDGTNYSYVMSETYTIREPYLSIQFYDENTLSKLDGNVSIVDLTNNKTYYADKNGLFTRYLTDIDWKEKQINAYVERKVNGVTTHTSRNLQFYWKNQDYNLNFALLPVGLGENIEFLVKDANNELWDNKYVQFNTTLNNIYYNNWTQRTSSFGNSNILSVVTDGNIWVAVGTSGKLATTTDPTGTWTQRTSSFETSHINSVAYENGVWVAVGDNGRLATATDPTGTWTQRTSSFGTSNIKSIAYGNGVWVAVGDSGTLATATDPTGTWTQRTSSFETNHILSVATDGTTWIAVGQYGTLATATDPTGTWTQRTSSFSTTYIYSVAYGNGVWVAVGDSGKLATATDPTGTWTQRTSSFETSHIRSVAYGNGVWVAVGANEKLAIATDPTGTWTQRTSSFPSTNNIWSVAYGNGVWVAVGCYGKLATLNHNFLNLKTSSSKTSPTGIFSDYLLTDRDYNAVLYDATGTEQVGSNLLKRAITLTFSEDVNAIIFNTPILFTNTNNIEIISSTLINYENYKFRFNQDPNTNQYYQFFEFIGSTSLTEDRNFQVYDINFSDETELDNYCYLEINVKEMHMSVENAVVELHLIDKNTGKYKLYGERLTNQYGTTYFYIPKTENPKFIVNKTGFEEFVWLENPITLNCANSEPIMINLKSEVTKPIFDYTSFWITKNEMNSTWGNNFWTIVTNRDENACFIYDPENQHTITDNIKFNFKIAEVNDTDELKMEIYLNGVLLKTEFGSIQITSINTITENDNHIIKTYINDELYNEYCVVYKDFEDYPTLGNEEVTSPKEIEKTIKTFRNDKSMGFFLVLIILILASIIGILTGKGMFAFLVLIVISLSLHNAFIWAGIVGIITIFGLIMKQGVNK